jgi:hypothetical protein
VDKQLEQEEWRDVAEYEGLYQVSDLGRVRSLDRIKLTSNKGREYQSEIKGVLLTGERSSGSERVILSKEGIKTWFQLSKLVASTFLKEPKVASLIHIDGNPFNNAVTNLKWVGSVVKPKENKKKVTEVKTYKTLAELKAAYDSGEISKENKLLIDNDYTAVAIPDPNDQDDYITVFGGSFPSKLLREALDLLGIPNESA